jgi:hypothetical protein
VKYFDWDDAKNAKLRTERGAVRIPACSYGDGGCHSGEARIAIMQEIRGRLVAWEGIAKLLRHPGGCGMVGDGHVNDPSTLVREDDEHEDHPERDGRPDEEVDGHDLSRVVREERSPRL